MDRTTMLIVIIISVFIIYFVFSDNTRENFSDEKDFLQKMASFIVDNFDAKMNYNDYINMLKNVEKYFPAILTQRHGFYYIKKLKSINRLTTDAVMLILKKRIK